MKRSGGWMGMMLLPVVAGSLLIGNRYVQGAEDEESADVVDTNAVVTMDTNPPVVHTVLESTLPEGVAPDSPYAQLIRLVQSGVDQGVILAYISKSPRFFELDADDIIYLTDIGTPPEVIEAVIAHDQKLLDEGIGVAKEEPQVAAETVEDEPPEVTTDEFYDALSPYGTWVYVEGYGRCWRPTVVIYDASWRPYCDNGRWVYTDSGWYWMSNYSWGWATFHYGRWFYTSGYGWCWWPDTVWAPSWVYWRYNNDYCGWAPLPPYTAYRSGIGLVYRGSAVSVGFDFHLGLTSFTFVSTRNFCDPNPRRYCVDRRNISRIYKHTRGDYRYDMDSRRRRIINHGIPTANIRAATRHEITPVSIRYSRYRSGQRTAVERFGRDKRSIIVGRPSFRPHATAQGSRADGSSFRSSNPIHAPHGNSSATRARTPGSQTTPQTSRSRPTQTWQQPSTQPRSSKPSRSYSPPKKTWSTNQGSGSGTGHQYNRSGTGATHPPATSRGRATPSRNWKAPRTPRSNVPVRGAHSSTKSRAWNRAGVTPPARTSNPPSTQHRQRSQNTDDKQ